MAQAWDRLRPRLIHRSAWLDHHGDLPVIEGTLIRLQVDHLPGNWDTKRVWLWSSRTGAARGEVDQLRQAFCAASTWEHTFRLFKQVPGWTARRSATPPPPTGGPGWSSPPMPSSASPDRWPLTCAGPRNAQPPKGG